MGSFEAEASESTYPRRHWWGERQTVVNHFSMATFPPSTPVRLQLAHQQGRCILCGWRNEEVWKRFQRLLHAQTHLHLIW
jgi:hypothetical protein